MKYLSSRNLYYILYVFVVIVVILIGFNIYFTIQIHNQLGKIVSQPGRWPVGAYVYDPVIGFDFAPNISGPIRDGSFYVKSHKFGYRIGKHEDASSFRSGGILSLGCSYTYGDEVESEQTFTQLIADSLGIPAYNYGVSSFSYIHALLKAQNLKEHGVLDKLKPTYVILGCWSGLLNRSRSPYPPILSENIPLVAAHICKDENEVSIHPPVKIDRAFELIDLYRKEGVGMSFKKFVKIFFIVPQILPLYLTNSQKSGKSGEAVYNDNVTDFEIYDYYFTAIENLFSPYGTQVIVLYMPYLPFDIPDKALTEVIAKHPDIIFVDGHKAVNKFNIPESEYRARHPQPAVHKSYAWETIEMMQPTP